MRERQIKDPAIFSPLLSVREVETLIISEARNLTVLYNIFVNKQNSVLLKCSVDSGEKIRTRTEILWC
jgi:hypothetical protein